MIKLVKCQWRLLFSEKSTYIILLSILFVIVVLLFFSGIYITEESLIVNSERMFHSYLIESIGLLKFIVIVYGIFIIFYVKGLHQLDCFFLSREDKLKVIVARIITITLMSIVLTVILYLSFLVIGFFLTPYMDSYHYQKLGFNLILFGIYYLYISYLIYLFGKNSYFTIFVVLFYFLNSIFTPYLLSKDQYTLFEEVVQLWTMDLVIMDDFTIDFYYPYTYIGFVLVTQILLILVTYLRKDIHF